MKDTLLSIQEAARLLKVSTKTLWRWEARGLITPERTSGNHRRYKLEDVENLKKNKEKKNILFPKNLSEKSTLFIPTRFALRRHSFGASATGAPARRGDEGAEAPARSGKYPWGESHTNGQLNQ